MKQHLNLFVFDGMDKAGKTTSLSAIRELVETPGKLDQYFTDHSYTNVIARNRIAVQNFLSPKNVEFFREPTDGPFGKQIRKMLADIPEPHELPGIVTARDFTQLKFRIMDLILLFSRDRDEQFADQKIEEKLASGKCIIYDRYYYSTLAYQTAYLESVIRKEGELLGTTNPSRSVEHLMKTILELSYHFPHPPKQNLFYLSISEELYAERCKNSDLPLESMEKNFEFQKLISKNYLIFAEKEIRDVKDPSQVIDPFLARLLFLFGARLLKD